MDVYRKLLPNNMRQIGETENRIKIYLEDYVCSYFSKLKRMEEDWCVGVLLGTHEERQGVPCLFISGAIESRLAEFSAGRLRFTDDTWDDILKKRDRYFPGMGVCGWFVQEKSSGMVDRLSLRKTHEEDFSEGDKVLLLQDDQEDEEFYTLWKGKLSPMKGYYIYYERNEAMREYMAGRFPSQVEEVKQNDQVIEDFRARLKERQQEADIPWSPPNISPKGWQQIKIGTAVGVAAVLLVSTISYRNQLKELSETDRNYVSMAAETAQVNADAGWYLAETGESLSQICMKIYGNLDLLQELCRINGISNPDRALDGELLTLP